jgi:hypothetical protein
MASLAFALTLVLIAQVDPAIDGPTVFAAIQRYQSSFRDVSFIHEGTLETRPTASGEPDLAFRFQAFYAYRNDGATLLDVYSQRSDRPKNRSIYSILQRRMESLDATPDRNPPIGARTPESAPAGPGSLGRYDSPEHIFLAWYFPTLGEAVEHDFEAPGWEDIGGHHCLKVKFLKQPKRLLKGWVGGLPYVRLWIDPQRDSYPIRYEFLRDQKLEVRGEITRMERVQLPGRRPIWVPAQGKVWGFFSTGERGRAPRTNEWTTCETHTILVDTLKFNRGLKDAFFSVQRHATVASDEGLSKLQRELESEASNDVERVPVDPESRRKRLDAALEESGRQAKLLEASSAARVGTSWFGLLIGCLAGLGVVLWASAAFWYWKLR